MSDNDFKRYDFEHPCIRFILEDKVRGLLGGLLLYKPYFKAFGLKGNESVLDFGCGGGIGSRCLANLLHNGGHLTCIDVSRYWMARARKRLNTYSNVECRLGDIRKLDIPDSFFDVISTFYVIHDIHPAERQDIVKALSRKLKAGGLFFIKEPVKMLHGMPAEAIRTLLSDASFNEIEHKETKSEYVGKYRRSD